MTLNDAIANSKCECGKPPYQTLHGRAFCYECAMKSTALASAMMNSHPDPFRQRASSPFGGVLGPVADKFCWPF